MIHNNIKKDRKPKARMRATGEVIKKNGERIPVQILGDPDMTKEELDEQLFAENREKLAAKEKAEKEKAEKEKIKE